MMSPIGAAIVFFITMTSVDPFDEREGETGDPGEGTGEDTDEENELDPPSIPEPESEGGLGDLLDDLIP